MIETGWNLAGVVDSLRGIRERSPLVWQNSNTLVRLPSRRALVGYTLDTGLRALRDQIRIEFEAHRAAPNGDSQDPELDRQATAVVSAFAEQLPRIRSQLDSDLHAAFRGDPAAGSLTRADVDDLVAALRRLGA